MERKSRVIFNLLIIVVFAALTPVLHLIMFPNNPIYQFEADFARFSLEVIRDHKSNPFVLVVVYMNHYLERYLNIFIMFVGSLYAIISRCDELKKMCLHFIYVLVALELAVLFNHLIFESLHPFGRISPNIALHLSKISNLYPNSALKVESFNTFPGGHAFAFFMWAFMYHRMVSKRVSHTFIFIATIMSLPRVLVGLHWITDVLYSVYLALGYRYFAFSIPKIRKYFINK